MDSEWQRWTGFDPPRGPARRTHQRGWMSRELTSESASSRGGVSGTTSSCDVDERAWIQHHVHPGSCASVATVDSPRPRSPGPDVHVRVLLITVWLCQDVLGNVLLVSGRELGETGKAPPCCLHHHNTRFYQTRWRPFSEANGMNDFIGEKARMMGCSTAVTIISVMSWIALRNAS